MAGDVVLVKQGFDAVEDLDPRKGFLHEIVGADALHVELLGRLRVAADHDDWHVFGDRVAAQRAQGVETVHAGQHDVEEDQARHFAASDLDAGFRIEGFQHVVLILQQHALEQGDDGRRVVDDQHPGAGARTAPMVRAAFGAIVLGRQWRVVVDQFVRVRKVYGRDGRHRHRRRNHNSGLGGRCRLAPEEVEKSHVSPRTVE